MTALLEDATATERYRTELTGYCYRLLGSGSEAEDAAQETLIRAWRQRERFDPARARLRTWLYALATNVCLDMLRSAQRRALATDLGPAAAPGSPLGTPLPERAFVLPVPDDRVLPAHGDPAELAAQRETVRLAFVAALQLLAPRQRGVLVLRDVLRFSAAEVAGQLGTSVAAVNSALQRARATLAAAALPPADPWQPDDPAQRDLLERYCAAFERYDVDALVALLHEDVTMAMPPFGWWLRGRAALRAVLLADHSCAGARLVPVAANGGPALWQTRPTGPGGAHEPFALELLELRDGLIAATTTFLDVAHLAALWPPATR